MVLTRRQRAKKLEAAIDGFMAVRAVALSAPPPKDPIPVVNLVEPEGDEEMAYEWEKDKENSANLLLMCLWCRHTGGADSTGQSGESQGDGDSVGKVTRVRMSKEARADQKRRRERLTEELNLLRKDIDVELGKMRAGSEDVGVGFFK